jgi:hypothetical protein
MMGVINGEMTCFSSFVFFSVQSPGSFFGDVGHTFNKLSVKNQKAKLFCFGLRKSPFSLYLIFNRRIHTIFFKKNSGVLTGGSNTSNTTKKIESFQTHLQKKSYNRLYICWKLESILIF